MFELALNDAIGYLAQTLVILWAYWITNILLKTFWIEERRFAYTAIGKVLSGVFCIVGWALFATAIYLMMKEIKKSYVVFIIGIVVSAFAIFRLYSNEELRDKIS